MDQSSMMPAVSDYKTVFGIQTDIALPPGPTVRDSTELSQSEIHDSLDGVHAVLSLVEDDRLGGLEDLVRDLHLVDAEFLGNLFSGRQWMKIAFSPALAMTSFVT